MSRQNKVNPGQYTQAGRLTPDDAAREMKKQRDTSPKNGEACDFTGTQKPGVTDEDKAEDEDATDEQER